MTRTLIGLDSEGVACVKITKGDIDPVTEPDSNYSSYYFNSKWAADIKLNYLEPTVTPVRGTAAVYSPAGATRDNYKKAVVCYDYFYDRDLFDVVIRNSYFDYMPYELPMFDLRWRRKSDGRYVEYNRTAYDGGADDLGREPEYYVTFDAGRASWWANMPRPAESEDLTRIPGNCLYYSSYSPYSGTGDSRLYETTAVIWRLPGDNAPLLDATPLAPVEGQHSVEINSTACRVAKPGYDVRTALPTQLAFDSSGRPLSIIYADDISIPAGVSSVDIGFPTTPEMLADMFPYRGTVITFPMARERSSLRFDYWFDGTSLFFNNKESFAFRVRFLVFANDREPLSVGDNDVLRQIDVDGENVVQFLRPGAGEPPALRDIVIDSRWPCLQILKEGYITTKTNGNAGGIGLRDDTYVVDFDGTGFFPIVKYMTFHNTSALGRHVKPPICAITRDYTDGFDYHQGRSTFCQISANQATFHTHNGNAQAETFNGTNWTYEFASAQVLGIRYFILGIPAA